MNYPWQIYHWHFEVSGKCVLKCPRCPRTVDNPVPWINQQLDLEFFKKVLTPDRLLNDVKRITMCGDIGDPIYNTEYLDIIEYIKSVNPKVHVFTITNGSYKKSNWWERFARISNEYDTINFSIDGYDDSSNQLYRVNSNWDSIMEGMEIMSSQSKIFVNWATIVFKFNQQHLDKIVDLAKAKGCDGVQITHSTKFGIKYAEFGKDFDPLQPDLQYISDNHRFLRHYIKLSDRVQPNQEYIEHKRQRFYEIKKSYNTMITPMCAIGNRGMYVTADGMLQACSWTGYPHHVIPTDRKSLSYQDSFYAKHRQRFNLRERSLEDVMQDPLWEKLFGSFNDPCKAWVECEQKCHADIVDENYAVGWLTN